MAMMSVNGMSTIEFLKRYGKRGGTANLKDLNESLAILSL